MYRADKLYNDMMAVDTAIKQLKVEDEASLAEYFRLYTELIFNHKWIGSIYGAATNKPLNSDACIAMSMATVKKISGRWQIVKEFTMYSIDEIRDTCTAEDAPGAAAEEVAK